MGENRILIIGSSNTDMVVKTNKIPVPGETVLGGAFLMNPGGKGANQAVAVARLGGKAILISKIGNDVFGKQSMKLFEEEGIDIAGVLTDANHPTGVALITVDEQGENSIVVAPGANAHLNPEDVEQVFQDHGNARIALLQLEIPLETVKYSAQIAFKKGIKVILNPAPADSGVQEILPYIDILTPNATEAELLSGIRVFDLKSAEMAAWAISEQGVKIVIVTMGKLGAVVLDFDKVSHVPAEEVIPVDTTGAGDAFNGALAVALSEGKSVVESVRFASKAAAITVKKLGAQSTMPYRKEIIPDVPE